MNFVFEKWEIRQWRRFLMPLVEMDTGFCLKMSFESQLVLLNWFLYFYFNIMIGIS